MTSPFIMAAPNGARRSKADHSLLPITLGEIVKTASACQAAGANGLHLHTRDDTGAHSLDAGRYNETLAELQQNVPTLAVQITTEAAGVYDVSEQLACLKLVRPTWASIALREIARAPELAAQVYGTCADNGTRVQHILYDAADYAQLRLWHQDRTVPADQTDMLFVLGRYLTSRSSQPSDLNPFMETHTGSARWMVCAFGAGEHTCLTHAAHLGGDVRVGFENSLTATNGTPWPDNAASVAALKAAIAHPTPQPEPIGG